MTFEEVYQQIRKMHYEILDERESISKSARLSLSTWMLDILTEYRDEWCDDCKRFNTVIRETLNREPSEDGTLEVKVEDATKVGRVLISDDKHRGGLYYPDEDEPEGDLISRADAIEALGEEPPVWCDEEYEIAERDQWRADVEAIKSVPSADRPTDEFDGMIFSTDKYMAFIDKKEIHIMRKGTCKVTMERMFNTEEDEK